MQTRYKVEHGRFASIQYTVLRHKNTQLEFDADKNNQNDNFRYSLISKVLIMEKNLYIVIYDTHESEFT